MKPTNPTLSGFLVVVVLSFACAESTFVARQVAGTPPQISVSQTSDLPEYGDRDVVFVLFSASRPLEDEGANAEAHDTAELEWWIFPFVANAAMMAFREQAVLKEGPAEWCGYNFRIVFADTCPGGPSSEECHNVYALESVLSRFQDDAGHPIPRVAIGGTFWGKPVAQMLSAMKIPTVGFWMGEQSLDDKREYPWFLRTYAGYGLLYTAILDMVSYFNYTRALMWHGEDEGSLESKSYALTHAVERGITLDTVAFKARANEFYPPEPDSDAGREWAASLHRAKTANAHCFIYTTVGTDPWLSFHLYMLLNGLFGPGYMWIQEFPVVNWWPRIYAALDAFAADSPYNTPTAYDGILSVDIDSFGERWQTWHDYVASLQNRSYDMEPWIMEKVQYQPRLWNQHPDDYPVLAHLLFDAIYATLWATNDLILESGGTDFSNKALLDRIWDSDFEATGGQLRFDPATGGRTSAIKIEQSQPPCDANGVRLPAPDLGSVKHVGTYLIDRNKPQAEWLNIFGDLVFYECSTKIPPDQDLPCEPGTYYHRRLGECLLCDIGKFSSVIGASECTSCQPGSFFNGTGAERCWPCQYGTFSDNSGATECKHCQPGEFQGEVLQSACRSCPAGSMNSESGSSTCESCAVGAYQPESGMQSCHQCQTGRSTEFPGSITQDDCLCPEGTLDMNGTCSPCPGGLSCAFGSALANWDASRNGESYVGAYPTLRPGFWSAAALPLDVYKCEDTLRCPGGDPGDCPHGLNGQSCASCAESYWWDSLQCRACKVGSSDSWLFPWIPVLATPVALVILYLLDDGDVTTWRSWKQSISCLGFVVLNHLQVITLLSQANFKVPQTTSDTSAIWEFTVDWMSLFKLECAGYSGVEYAMFFRTFAPMLLVLWVCVLYAIFKIVSLMARKPEYHMQGARIFDVLMSIVFSFFTAIVAMSLLLYKCEDNPNGTSSLKADRVVLCYEAGTWQDLLALSVVAVVFYCGGMAALFIWAILRARYRFADVQFQKRWKFLFIRYRLSTWWWSLSFLGKNVFFNLALVVTFNGLGQLYIMMSIICGYMILVITFMPYRVQLANYLEIFTSLSAIGSASVMTHFVEDVDSQLNKLDALGSALIILPLPMAVAYVLHIVYLAAMKQWKKNHGVSARDELFSRLFTASAALVDLNTSEVSAFLDRVDEPDRHVIKKALVIMETEILGYAHWRLTFTEAPMNRERLEAVVQNAMQGKTFQLRNSQVGKVFSGDGTAEELTMEKRHSGGEEFPRSSQRSSQRTSQSSSNGDSTQVRQDSQLPPVKEAVDDNNEILKEPSPILPFQANTRPPAQQSGEPIALGNNGDIFHPDDLTFMGV